MELPPLLRPSYWLDTTPPPLMPWAERALLVVFVAMLFVGILGRIFAMKQGWEKMTKKMLIRTTNRLTILGLFGLLLYVITFERVTILSARVGYLLWLALLAWYVWQTVKYFRVDLPAMQQRQTERDALNKWLPKSKA